MQNIYVVVADNDRPISLTNLDEPHVDDGGPLIFEQYVRTADLENIKKRRDQLSLRYGKCRIAKLVFIDSEPMEHADA